MIRRLAILHRRPDVSPQELTHYWNEQHAPRVLEVPAVLKFATNLVLECRVGGGGMARTPPARCGG